MKSFLYGGVTLFPKAEGEKGYIEKRRAGGTPHFRGGGGGGGGRARPTPTHYPLYPLLSLGGRFGCGPRPPSIRGHGGGEWGGIPPSSTHFLFSKVQTFWDPYLLSSPPKPSTPRPCMPLLLLLLNEPKNYFHLAGSPRLFLSSSCCVRRSHSRCLRRREREKITTERVDQKKKGTLLLPRATQKFFVCGRGPFKKKGQIFGEPPPVPRRHGEGAEKEKKNEKESHLPPPPCYIPRIPFHLLFFFFHPKFFSDFFVWDTTVHYTT